MVFKKLIDSHESSHLIIIFAGRCSVSFWDKNFYESSAA